MVRTHFKNEEKQNTKGCEHETESKMPRGRPRSKKEVRIDVTEKEGSTREQTEKDELIKDRERQGDLVERMEILYWFQH
jgi:hypothetical protein